METLVTFYSESGNTEKLANAVFEGIVQTEKEIMPIKDVSGMDSYDLIFCGFPVQSSSVPAKAEAFIKNIPTGKNVAFFTTHGSLRGGELAITAFYYALTLASHLNVLGTFGCRGKVKEKIVDELLKKAEHKAWAEEALSAAEHPNATDLEEGKEWARWMVARAQSHLI
jgi:flavodoxin